MIGENKHEIVLDTIRKSCDTYTMNCDAQSSDTLPSISAGNRASGVDASDALTPSNADVMAEYYDECDVKDSKRANEPDTFLTHLPAFVFTALIILAYLYIIYTPNNGAWQGQ